MSLSFIVSQRLSFKIASAWLFSIEVSIIVFVKFSEVFFIVSVTGSNTIFIFS